MNNVFLDLELMETAADAKKQIRDTLKLRDSFTGTLESLYDHLCAIGKPTSINLVNASDYSPDSPAYQSQLLKVFLDASEENGHLKIVLL